MELNFTEVLQNDYTGEDILSRISEESILEYYLGEPISFKEKVFSPFRKERRPSFSFKQNGNIIWKDWGTGEAGNCFKFVMKKYGCTYYEALRIIYNDFFKGKQVSKMDDNVLAELKLMKEDHLNSVKKYTQIYTVPKPFCITDYKFWSKYGISLTTLLHFEVTPCEEVWLSKYNHQQGQYDEYKLINIYSNTNPIYSYLFRNKERESCKIYSPYAERQWKFISNEDKNTIEGYTQLPQRGKLLLLTKSLKDTMSLYSLGFSACSFQSEAFMPSTNAINELKDRFERVVVFYDNDQTGQEFSKKIANKHMLENISVPSIDYEAKDISDLIKYYSIKEAKNLMKILL